LKENPCFLYMHDISKQYHVYGQTTQALDHVDFSVRRGTVHGLLGENGAGKTTLMKILSGVETGDGGEIFLEGRKVQIRNAQDAIGLRIGIVHQHFSLIEEFTVLENVVLGREKVRWPGVVDKKKIRSEVEETMKKSGLVLDLDRKVGTLAMGEKQKIEILRLLYDDADILIFDEPTSVLVEQETRQLLSIIRTLKEQGRTIIYISHKVDEVLSITDELTILRAGHSVATGLTSEQDADSIVELMVGKKVEREMPRLPVKKGECLLSVKDLSVREGGVQRVKGVSFEVRSGEIAGIIGINGNGQLELVNAVCGLVPASGGQVLLKGEDITLDPVLKRRQKGLGYIPEDRIHVGSCSGATIAENMEMGQVENGKFERRGCLEWKSIRGWTAQLISEYHIKAPDPDTLVGALSGGHIQRVIIAREFSGDPSVLLAGEITMGLDVESVRYIHSLMLKMRENGKAILLVTSDINEILELSDRILVMHEGRMTAVLENGDGLSKNMIGEYMLGLKDQFAQGSTEKKVTLA